jgi:hypothetical protein
MWILVAALVLLAVYPVGGTLVLSTGLFERLMRSEDLRIEIDKPAWTLWPGHIHVAGARVFVNGETQFILGAKNLLIHVNLFPLVKKRLRVTKITGDDVRYFMRVQVEDSKGIERRLAAYPPLEGLPGDPTLSKKKAQNKEEREGDFTVDTDGIDISIAELWFMEYHYVGPGKLTGGFLIGPNKMRVNTSVQELGPGELRFGKDQVVLEDFAGRIQAQIPELNPMEHADESFLELVTSDVELKGNTTTLEPVGAYATSVTVREGQGPFEARVVLDKGRLGETSKITFATDEVRVRGNGFDVVTDWDFVAKVGKAEDPKSAPHESDRSVLPRILSKSEATYISLVKPRREPFTIHVREHRHDVVLRTNQLGRMTDIDHARIRFPMIFTNDLADLAPLTDGGAIESQAGELRASLVLDVDEEHVATGGFNTRFRGLRFGAAGMLLRGQGDGTCRIHVDIDKKATALRDMSVDLSEVGMHVGDETVEGWWTKVRVPYLGAWGFPPERFEGRVSVVSKSAEPILKALAGKDEIPGIVPDLTSLNDLRIRGKFRKDRTETDVLLEPLENELFDVAGRYYSKGEHSWLAVVVGGKAVSLGIAKNASGTTWKPFAREGWLNEQLRSFPKQSEKIRSSQP